MKIEKLEQFIRKSANKIGFDIKRYNDANSEFGHLSKMLKLKNINLVLDVGANTGQYASSLRRCGYDNQIISFEPIKSAWLTLKSNSAHDPLWQIAPQCAIGSIDGDTKINISRNSVSSSLLEMLDAHSDAAPNSKVVYSEQVPIKKLDTIVGNTLTEKSKIFLKIDTQGYEDYVLKGAKFVLEHTVGLQLELSFIPLYKDQKIFDVFINELIDIGFEIWSIWPGFTDNVKGRMLQADVILFRNFNLNSRDYSNFNQDNENMVL